MYFNMVFLLPLQGSDVDDGALRFSAYILSLACFLSHSPSHCPLFNERKTIIDRFFDTLEIVKERNMGCTGSTNALPPNAGKRPMLKMANGISSGEELPTRKYFFPAPFTHFRLRLVKFSRNWFIEWCCVPARHSVEISVWKPSLSFTNERNSYICVCVCEMKEREGVRRKL